MGAAVAWRTLPPPREPIYHVGRRSDPFYWWTPPPLDLAQPAAGRFDDPCGEYATLYCATTRYGALLEKLSPLRPIPELAARYDAALDDDVDAEYDRPPIRTTFPADVCVANVIGAATIDPNTRFINVEDPDNHRLLEQHGGHELLTRLGVSRIDRGTFSTNDRALTRRIARELYDHTEPAIGGLRFLSAIDGEVECWAIWERTRSQLRGVDVEPFDTTTPDLRAVVGLLGFDRVTEPQQRPD